MDLWIRSQDKETLSKEDIIYSRASLSQNQQYIIWGSNVLARYKTKERALEVLDEIQSLLRGDKVLESLNTIGGNMNNVFPIMVYQMPEDKD